MFLLCYLAIFCISSLPLSFFLMNFHCMSGSELLICAFFAVFLALVYLSAPSIFSIYLWIFTAFLYQVCTPVLSSLIYLYPRHLSVLPLYVISLWVSLHVWIEATCICQYITTNPLYTLWFLLRCFAWGLR